MAGEQKSHKPTKKKLEDARKEGKVLKSQVLTQAAGFATALVGIYLISSWAWVSIQILLKYCIVSGVSEPLGCFQEGGAIVVKVVVGILLVVSAVGLLVEGLQVGFRIEPKIVSLRLSRLDPAAGFKRICSDGWKRSIEILGRAALIVLVFFWLFWNLVPTFFTTFFVADRLALRLGSGMLSRVAIVGAALLLVCAAADYLLRRRQFFREQSMSVDEVRRELKDDEGDPLFKAFRKHQHEALLMQDLVRRVRASRVIVVEKQ